MGHISQKIGYYTLEYEEQNTNLNEGKLTKKCISVFQENTLKFEKGTKNFPISANFVTKTKMFEILSYFPSCVDCNGQKLDILSL